MNDNIFTGMMERLEDGFLEMASEITASLCDTNPEYAALFERRLELQSRFPCIGSVLEGEGTVTMTTVEHAGLLEYLGVVNDMENIERQMLYYAGHRDCLAYLKKIGAV